MASSTVRILGSPMKMMDGDWVLAWANKSRTLAGPTPTNISMKSDPLIERNGTAASPAVALASNVFPVPGGPVNRAPLGIFAPISLYLPGLFKNLTNSMISVFASSHPATSLNMTLSLAFLSTTWICTVCCASVWLATMQLSRSSFCFLSQCKLSSDDHDKLWSICCVYLLWEDLLLNHAGLWWTAIGVNIWRSGSAAKQPCLYA